MPVLEESLKTTDGEECHIVSYDGEPGEFHCLNCLAVSNYITDDYCCNLAKNIPKKVKQAEGHFVKMVFRQHVIDQAITAMEEGKRLVKKDGSCVHCRNTKQHEEGWCKSKTKVFLFKHFILKENIAIEKDLDKYLHLRQTICTEAYQVDVEKAEKAKSDLMGHKDPKLEKSRRDRAIRKIMREKELLENEKTRKSRWLFVADLMKKQDAVIIRLQEADKLHVERIKENEKTCEPVKSMTSAQCTPKDSVNLPFLIQVTFRK